MTYSETKTKNQSYRIAHKKYGTAEQFIEELSPLIVGPMQTCDVCEGDMWLSDYRQLRRAYCLLQNK